MFTLNIGGVVNKSDFIMTRNSITAPVQITWQVQSSECRKIPFYIVRGSLSSVEEDSSLLV
jgi:hypothetical protein